MPRKTRTEDYLVLVAQLSAAIAPFRNFLEQAWEDWDAMDDDERKQSLIGERLLDRGQWPLSRRQLERIERRIEQLNAFED